MLRRSLMLAVVVCLAAALSGCGGYGSEETVTVEVSGISGDSQRESIEEHLKGLVEAGFKSTSIVWAGESMTIELAPVRDVQAFARKISTGTVESVDGRTIKLSLSGAKPAARKDNKVTSTAGASSGADESDDAVTVKNSGTTTLKINGKEVLSNKDGVTVEVAGVSGDDQKESLEKQLKGLLDSGFTTTSTIFSGQTMTMKLAPVEDAQGFADRIKFGKVESVDGRTIKVSLGN